MSKLVYGVGFNDRSRPTWVDGKIVKEYDLWHSMIQRCYSEKFQNNHTAYKGCSVSNNFLNYSFFYDWCQEQVGFKSIDKKGRHYQLDKDILSDKDKTYSETTCVFLPAEINSFFADCGNNKWDYRVGVYFDKHRNKFATVCRVDGGKKVGFFNTAQEAFLKYKSVKEALCKELALKWKDEIDHRVFESMMNWEVKE